MIRNQQQYKLTIEMMTALSFNIKREKINSSTIKLNIRTINPKQINQNINAEQKLRKLRNSTK